MATDSKKEAFRKFLETAGVVDMLTKSLVQLYEEPEKPTNAIDYVRTAFGAPTPAEFDAIVEEKNALTAKVEEMTAQMAALQEEIEQLKSAQENQEGDAAAE
mmetsp:Transcript_32779/g.61651  ORF Transcript_32779/g.61651 Transcript_32779/m.61651 type:complete len:102 (+) Transcript_32779:66-371(+)|eukprot:CAMPEP_0114243840 /NCGR_PEP_ID=MMETSP0058-20121206/11009_1 /TAXON_ID=36894 /ORGANISM="Pyramimonas parkeae, CCMP726" /LENGTH=101 /DNA_ID=CAMNT_0001356717 /DNA_START=484 /DNA_END=789 /DNA_ORIENTATION=-